VYVQEFWRRYRAMPADSRHHYEIIREGSPCHLYFDLEFDTSVNRKVDGAHATRCLLALVQEALHTQFQTSFADSDVVQLDSTTDGVRPVAIAAPLQVRYEASPPASQALLTRTLL